MGEAGDLFSVFKGGQNTLYATPVWTYAGGGIRIEKRVVLMYGYNTVMIAFRLVDGGPLRLELRPGVQFRGHSSADQSTIIGGWEGLARPDRSLLLPITQLQAARR